LSFKLKDSLKELSVSQVARDLKCLQATLYALDARRQVSNRILQRLDLLPKAIEFELGFL
jgi:hypothetical protein